MYTCNTCGKTSVKKLSYCLVCHNSDTYYETVAPKTSKKHRDTNIKFLNELNIEQSVRIVTGIEPLDRVFGGGIISDSIALIGGTSGAGKSTLAITMLAAILRNNPDRVGVFISGEESISQLKQKFDRLQCSDVSDRIVVEFTHSIDRAVAILDKVHPILVVVDSINTVCVDENSGSSGSLTQIIESISLIRDYAKTNNTAFVVISQVTKDGDIAGPKKLEHTVDVVLHFEDDNDSFYKILRSSKNRDGDISEILLCTMTSTGLEFFNNTVLFSETNSFIGSAPTAIQTGSRYLFTQVQTLVEVNVVDGGNNERTTATVNRLQYQRIEAIMNKFVLSNTDLPDDLATLKNYRVHLAVVWGLKSNQINDLAIAASLLSSILSVPIPQDTLWVGESTLVGSIGSFPNAQRLLLDASNFFNTIYLPEKLRGKVRDNGNIEYINDMSQLVNIFNG